MMFYFIIFTIVGIVIGSINREDEGKAIGIIIIIAIIWGIAYAPVWGLASLGEMALGYFISRMFK